MVVVTIIITTVIVIAPILLHVAQHSFSVGLLEAIQTAPAAATVAIASI